MDLSKLSKEDLDDLRQKVDKELVLRQKKAKQNALKQIQEIAEKAGYSIDELLGQGGRQQRKGVPKYRHPDDPRKTWTGRGRRPGWLEDLLKSGKKLEDLEI